MAILSLSSPVKARQWEEIQEKKVITIGVKDNLPPLAYYSLDEKLQGLEIDIAHRLAEKLLGDASAVKFIPLSNESRLSAVINGEVDFAIASLTANASRRRLVDFTDFYYLSGTGIIIPQSPSISSLHSLTIIGVLRYSRAIADIKYRFPHLTLREVTSYQEALNLLETNQIQGFAGDITVLTGWIQQYPQYQLLNTILGSYPLAIALPRGRQYQELRDKVNQVMRELRQSGWLEERAKYWGLPVN